MKRDSSGANTRKEGLWRQRIGFDGTCVFADGGERMCIRTGDHRFAMLLGPAGRAQVGVDVCGQPADVNHAPFDRIDAVDVIVQQVAEATRVGIERMRSQHEYLRLSRAQGTDFFPGRRAGQIALGDIQHDQVLALVHIGLHAGNQKNAARFRIRESLGIGANLAMPRHSNGVESHFLRAVDMLKNRVAEISIDGIAMAMTMQLDTIRWHGAHYARVIALRQGVDGSCCLRLRLGQTSSMVRQAIFSIWCLLFMGLPTSNKDHEELYRGQIEWARLKTQDPQWARHSRSDPRLLRFIHDNTTLDIDTEWHSADVENLRQMTAYPFLFSAGIQGVADEEGRENIREYLQRGGFVFIDACINTTVNPDPDAFLKMQIDTLSTILPKVKVERLPDDHAIFRSCFEMKDGLPHTYMNNQYNPVWAKHGLYAVYSEKHFVGLISLSGLQCGWDGMFPNDDHITNCMKMMVNIYVYVVEH